jgi:16S rRNA (adenine1518-N6/adenine1519-N6)-dimethyltransferase
MTRPRTKRLGQHMLMDEKALDYEAAMLRPEGKIVLEIGGGTGNLSKRIAETAKKLIIVEKDELMAETLAELFEFDEKKNVRIIHSDFLDLTESEIMKQAKVKRIDLVISNVPYAISSPLLFRLPGFGFEQALLCLQKEFVQRMVAKPGDRDWSRLSVMTNLYFKPIFLRSVKRGSFRPIPQVDSAMVMLTKTDEKHDEKRDKFIERLFSHRKNTMHSALRAEELETNYPNADSAAEKLGLAERRVSTLTIDEIKRLFAAL